jgi:hypothetical protein
MLIQCARGRKQLRLDANRCRWSLDKCRLQPLPDRAEYLAFEFGNRVGALCRHVEKRERDSLAQTVQERVAIPTLAILMRPVIELDRANDREVAFVTQQEIEVLGLNAVESLLAIAVAQPALCINDIGETNLGKNAIVVANRLVEHTEK